MDERTQDLVTDFMEDLAEGAEAARESLPIVTEPLMDRIERDRRGRRVARIVMVVALAIMAVAFLVAGVLAIRASIPRATPTGVTWNVNWCGLAAPLGFVATMGVGVLLLFLRKPSFTQTARLFSAHLARGGEVPNARRALGDMALRVGVTTPVQLFVIESDHLNAYAVGKSVDACAMGITRHMAELLSVDELRAVFAHLLARVAIGNAAQGADHLPVSIQADAEGMYLLGDPRSMLSALEHLRGADTSTPTAGSGVMDAQFFAPWMVVPEMLQPLTRLNEVSVEERVARLRAVLGAEGVAV